MATKTISLELDAYDKPRSAKKPGESFFHATVHRRGPSSGFFRKDYVGTEAVVPLPEIEIDLPLSEVYEWGEF